MAEAHESRAKDARIVFGSQQVFRFIKIVMLSLAILITVITASSIIYHQATKERTISTVGPGGPAASAPALTATPSECVTKCPFIAPAGQWTEPFYYKDGLWFYTAVEPEDYGSCLAAEFDGVVYPIRRVGHAKCKMPDGTMKEPLNQGPAIPVSTYRFMSLEPNHPIKMKYTYAKG